MAILVILVVAFLAVFYLSGLDGSDGRVSVTSTESASPAGSEAGREWVVRDASVAGSGHYDVGVSDDLLVTSGAGGLIAYPHDGGPPVALSAFAYPEWDVEGSIVVWAEVQEAGDADPGVRSTVWVRHLPDGAAMRVAAAEGVLRRPRVSGGMIAWAQPRPSPEPADSPSWQYQSIFVAPLESMGLSVGTARVVVSDATELLEGDAPWVYDLDPPYLGWQQDVAVEGRPIGGFVIDMESGVPVLSGEDASMLTMAAGRVAFETPGGLELLPAVDGVSLVDPLGERPALSPRFLAYLRPMGPGAGAAGDRQVVVREIESGREWVLGRPPADLWYRPPPSVSDRFVAYLGVDGAVELFEWQGQ